MRVFVTGATGFVGSTVVKELLGRGHSVIGLSRSDEGAKSLAAAGAEVHRGSLEDPASLRRGAAQADGVIHCGFIHDFSKFKENCEIDRRAIQALGAELAGSDRPLVITSGTAMAAQGGVATENDAAASGPNAAPRVASEEAAAEVAARGVRACVVRLPQVHDRDKSGLGTYVVELAERKGVSVYVGEGRNRWAAVHRDDVAPVYRLALEKGVRGARYHAVGEEGVAFRDIAAAIGRRLGLPVKAISREEAPAHFGWLAHFAELDMPASGAITRKLLGWQPRQTTGLIADLDLGRKT